MPTLSFHLPRELERKVRKEAKFRQLTVSEYLKRVVEDAMERQERSFGAWARKVAGMINTGEKDLSMREGFDD